MDECNATLMNIWFRASFGFDEAQNDVELMANLDIAETPPPNHAAETQLHVDNVGALTRTPRLYTFTIMESGNQDR